jgi:hypothetical protein
MMTKARVHLPTIGVRRSNNRLYKEFAPAHLYAILRNGFTTFRLQALDAGNVLHHTVTGMTGRGQQ